MFGMFLYGHLLHVAVSRIAWGKSFPFTLLLFFSTE